MARIARVVVPNIPHHVTQRGSRRMETFFCDRDYQNYIDLMANACEKVGTQVWAYCLMPNHVHLIMVPNNEDGLRGAIAEAHRRYARKINVREQWCGHLWQERFHSYPMDEQHLLAAVRYVELNPVVAGLCEKPDDWSWSSARAHGQGKDDKLVKVAPMLKLVSDWERYLIQDEDDVGGETIERHLRTGRPMGSMNFIEKLEKQLGRSFRQGKPGRKCKAES